MKKFMQLFERLVVAVENRNGDVDDLHDRLDKLEAACFDHFQLQRHTRKQKLVEEIVAEHADPR